MHMGLPPSRRGVELQKDLVQRFVHFHNGRLIAAPVTVIGCRKDRHDCLIVAPIVPVHDELVGPADQREGVPFVELLRHVLSKGKAGAAGRNAPPAAIVGVGPEQVAHGALVGDLLDAVELADVIEGINAGGEAAVQTENGVFDEGGEGEVVEEVSKEFPYIGTAVFADAFVVKAVNLSNLSALVVASQYKDAIRVSNFPTDQEGNRFNGVVATIDVITSKEIVGIWGTATNTKEFH